MTVWRRILLCVYIALLIALVGSLVFHYSAAWFGIAGFVLAIVNFVMFQREATRKARDGSDGGPPLG